VNAPATPASVAAPERNRWLELADDALLRQCRREAYQASGPGGQKRNRVYSAVRLTHTPSGIAVTAAESRSAQRNLAIALHRLRRHIAMEVRGAPLSPPVLADLRLNPENPRHPRLLAAVADALHGCEFRIAEAAATLGLSTGQLVRFLARDPETWQRVNEQRHARGLPPLRA
jgi:hypothetical protein